MRARLLLALLLVPAAGLFAAANNDLFSDREREIHALGRRAFGPGPGDVDRVAATG